MARSYSIHIVLLDGKVQAAFTVKHEMEYWLTKHPGGYEIVRVRDGGW